MEIAAFLQSVRRGTPPPVTGEDGAAAVAVIEAVEQSIAAYGRTVAVGLNT
jgi:predicted dehydrogenase